MAVNTDSMLYQIGLAVKNKIDQSIGSGSGSSYTTTLGDGSSTSFNVAHNLGTENIVFSVLDKTNNDYEQVTTEYVDDNTTKFTFSSAPTTNQYSITISSGGGGGGANIMQSIAVNMILN